MTTSFTDQFFFQKIKYPKIYNIPIYYCKNKNFFDFSQFLFKLTPQYSVLFLYFFIPVAFVQLCFQQLVIMVFEVKIVKKMTLKLFVFVPINYWWIRLLGSRNNGSLAVSSAF